MQKFLVLLGIAIWISGCSKASLTPARTVGPMVITIAPTPTPPSLVIDLTVTAANQDLSHWKLECAGNTSGKSISELPTIEPNKAIVLSLDPKSNLWEESADFPTLIDTSGQPKYLVCIFRTWTYITSYNISDNKNIPGYREDWMITIEDLDTNAVYTTKVLIGQEPPYEALYDAWSIPTEIVGNDPKEQARAMLLARQNVLFSPVTLTVPYGFQSLDFAPDSRSLLVPFDDGYRQWDFTTDSLTPLDLNKAPITCGLNSRYISTALNGQTLITACYLGDFKFATEVWAADTLEQKASFTTDYYINPQFELQGNRIVSYRDTINTLDLSTGEVTSSPLGLTGDVRWVSAEAKYVIEYISEDGTYQLWDFEKKKVIASLNDNLQNPYISRDGRRLFSSFAQGNVTIQVLSVENMLPQLTVIAEPYSEYFVSPNGRVLAILTINQVTLIDLDNLSVLKTIPVENPGWSLLFSPDGEAIVLPFGTNYSSSYMSSPAEVVVLSTGLP
ncbi:MAG: WD40 repeat domain-containing protein [Chloroflexi bacterium]|nr:MAG: WD40 repeat domain-containing protein [Chloroflexota bacterium]